MTNEQILKKAIEKAIKMDIISSRYLIEWIEEKDEQWGTLMDSTSVETIIFSHNFAKAFWGEEIKCIYCNLNQLNHKITSTGDYYECSNCGLLVDGESAEESWKTHLQQMVLEEDPIKYLEKFL